MSSPRRGEIYWVALEPTVGAEIRGKPGRPCVVLTSDVLNERRRTVIVVPLTSTAPARPPLKIGVTANGRPGFAAIEHLRSVDKQRLGQSIGKLVAAEMEAVEDALREVLEL